ncbi:MAG TPA: response regulator [Candidatus Limnocylindrales bacterium]|nr:response regulator [Candidatus Limnocylindrales bacterium]
MGIPMARMFDFASKQARPRAKTQSAPAATGESGNGTEAGVAESASHSSDTARPVANACSHATSEERANERANDRPKEAAQAAKHDRRHRRRVKISAPVRVRHTDTSFVNEFDLTMTIDVSREGLLFETSRATYQPNQEVAIVFPYQPASWEPMKEQRGQVVRVARASEKRFSVAVAFLTGEPTYDLVDALGQPLKRESEPPKVADAPQHPLILVVEEDPRVRAQLRMQLELEGYAVEAASDPNLAATIMRHRAPAALICEAEPFPGAMPGGGEMSGYDLCVIARRNPKYARMPIILTTRTGMPSDFATAHALGATACVAKPYDLDRVANLVRMFAPVNAT